MDITTQAVFQRPAEQWGVVYPYGSVLAIFENEQDALSEASCFGGAVVRIVQEVWSAVSADSESGTSMQELAANATS